MMTAKPEGFFSTTWQVSDGDTVLATLSPSVWSEKAELYVPGSDTPLTLDKEGWVSNTFRLRQGDTVVVTARKPSILKSAFVLDIGEAAVQLKPDSCFHSSFTLYDGDAALGTIKRLSVFSRRVTLDLPEGWPLPLRLFVFWLVLVIWDRDNATAASS